MRLHGNAALTVKKRLLPCERVVERSWTLTKAAEAADVSVRTAPKWVRRYRDGGEAGQRGRGAGWEYCHVAVDDATRLAHIEVLGDEKPPTAIAFLRRAIGSYRACRPRHDRQRLGLRLAAGRRRLPRAREAGCGSAAVRGGKAPGRAGWTVGRVSSRRGLESWRGFS